jgi:hypothetical protein
MSYYVQCLDGPAEGFAYITMMPPSSRITIAPLPGRDGEWFRVPDYSPPWIGQCDYVREELPKLGVPKADDEITSDGDILANYFLQQAVEGDPDA